MDWSEMTDANIEAFGESVTYTPGTGAASTVSVVIGRDEERSEQSDDGLEIIRSIPVEARASDLPNVVRSDRATGKPYLTFDGKDWNISGVQTVVTGLLHLTCYRRETIEKSNRQHRLPR